MDTFSNKSDKSSCEQGRQNSPGRCSGSRCSASCVSLLIFGLTAGRIKSGMLFQTWIGENDSCWRATTGIARLRHYAQQTLAKSDARLPKSQDMHVAPMHLMQAWQRRQLRILSQC